MCPLEISRQGVRAAVRSEPTLQPSPTTVDTMTEDHWSDVRAIYQAGIDTGHATFATAPPATWAAWQQDHLKDLSLVVVRGTAVVGWASLAGVSGRCVYAGVAEVSVYIAPDARGRGVGRQLLAALIERSEANHLWTLQAGIFPENQASVALHRAAGFEPVGLRRRLGKMEYGPLAGRWRDVLLLERRSNCVGTD
jgi:L-amino acid N-acyltransferase YncA